jgi:hypothetical protein
MPWNDRYSPLDKTIDRLEWLARQMRADLERDAEVTADDYRLALLMVESGLGDLRPLQDFVVQERR